MKPYIFTLLAATIGAASGIIIKTAALPSTTMSFFRLVVPVAVLFFYLRYKKIKLFRGDYRMMLVSSVLNAIRMWFYILAFDYTTVGNGTIVLFTWPMFATLFGWMFLKERIEKITLGLMAVSFLGVVIVYINKNISFQDADFLGMTIMLSSAVIFALTTIIFKKESQYYTKEETVFYQNLAGAVIFFPFVFINKYHPTILQITLGVSYGFWVGVVAFILFFYSLKRLNIAHYSILTYWEVPCAAILGWIFFKESITWNVIVGGGLVVISGVLLMADKYLKRKVSPSEINTD